MVTKKLSGGLVHELPDDLIVALTGTPEITSLWENLTPIGRNEFICWVEDAKREETRARRIQRAVNELLDGQKRPCCWAGCIHRTDKKPGKWQQDVLIDKKQKKWRPMAVLTAGWLPAMNSIGFPENGDRIRAPTRLHKWI